jgi:hypothetical protein
MKDFNSLRWSWCGWHETPCVICPDCKNKSCCGTPCEACRPTQPTIRKAVKFGLTKAVKDIYGVSDHGVPRIEKLRGTVSFIVLRARLAELFGLQPEQIWGRPVCAEDITLL